jgi:hypothetical protein
MELNSAHAINLFKIVRATGMLSQNGRLRHGAAPGGEAVRGSNPGIPAARESRRTWVGFTARRALGGIGEVAQQHAMPGVAADPRVQQGHGDAVLAHLHRA